MNDLLKKQNFARLLVASTLLLLTFSTSSFSKTPPKRGPLDPVSKGALNPFDTIIATPSEYGYASDEVEFKNALGITLRGWYFTQEKAAPTILVCVGNTGNISYSLPYAALLADAGFEVLIFDYQGFGLSDGTAALTALPGDCQAALNYLLNVKKKKANEIGAFGISLGSVLALSIATRNELAAVALEDVFIPSDHLEKMKGQLKSTIAKFALTAVERLVLPQVDPITNAKKLKAPLFLIHGERDWLLPASGSIKVAQARQNPTHTWIIESSGHAPEPLATHDGIYQYEIQNFFKNALTKKNSLFPRATFEVRSTEEKTYLSKVQIKNITLLDGMPTPVQIYLASGYGEGGFFASRPSHSFKRIWATTQELEIEVKTQFKPKVISVFQPSKINKGKDFWLFPQSDFTKARNDYFKFQKSFASYPIPVEIDAEKSKKNEYEWVIPWKTSDLLAALPRPKKIHPRVIARYARHLARCSQLLKHRGSEKEALLLIQAMLTYIPKNPDKHYELSNANFRTGLNEPAMLTCFGVLTDELISMGEWKEAQTLLQSNITLLFKPKKREEPLTQLKAISNQEGLKTWRDQHLNSNARNPFKRQL